jgi:hypothetical protein
MKIKSFKILVGLSFLFSISTGLVEYFWNDPLVVAIDDLLSELEPTVGETEQMLQGAIALLYELAFIVSIIGLLMTKWWAKHLYLAAHILLLLFCAVTINVSYSSGFVQALWDLDNFFGSLIIILLYFSPISKYYERP